MKPKKEHYRGKLPHFQQPGQWYSVTCVLKGALPKGAMDKYATRLETAKNQYLLLKERAAVSGVGLSKSDMFDLRKSNSQLAEARKNYYIALRKYRLAYDKVLHRSNQPTINLTKENNRKLVEEALLFWEGKRLKNHAWCIMSNHIHWVLSLFEQESGGAGVGLGKSNTSNLRPGKPQSRELEFPNSNMFDFGKSNSQRESDFPKPGNFDLKTSKSQSGEPVYLQDILHSVKLFTARLINQNENKNGQLWEHESFDTTIRNSRHFENVMNYTIKNPVSAGLVKDWRDWPGTRIFGSWPFPNT